MAREIILNLGGEVSRLAITSINRTKLYGRKRRMIVDQNDQPCSAGLLTRDGSALIPAGGISNLYVEDGFHVVERGDLQAIDAEGEPVESVGSTLGVEQELEGPLDASVVLDYITTAVYQLDPEELGDGLKDSLEKGDVYRFPFAYRAGFSVNPAFLVGNGDSYFALVGAPSGFEFLHRDVQVEEEDEEADPFDDDFDFSMM